jgi:hypothetical protein
MKKTGLTVCLLLLANAAPWAHARTAAQCAYVEERQARLACYDEIFRAPQAKPTAPPATPATPAAEAADAPVHTESVAEPVLESAPAVVAESPVAAATPVVVATPAAAPQPTREAQSGREAEFGQEDVIINDPAQDDRLRQIEAHITEIKTLAFGKRQFTLDNGQVWRQIEFDRKRFKADTGVMIKRAGLGSYILLAENGVSTRVTRIH